MINCPICGSRIPTDDESHQVGDCQCSRERMARVISMPVGPGRFIDIDGDIMRIDEFVGSYEKLIFMSRMLVRGGYLDDEINAANPLALEIMDAVGDDRKKKECD